MLQELLELTRLQDKRFAKLEMLQGLLPLLSLLSETETDLRNDRGLWRETPWLLTRTGTGKTHLYLRLLRELLENEKRTIPEPRDSDVPDSGPHSGSGGTPP
jgi:hypothetical protein